MSKQRQGPLYPDRRHFEQIMIEYFVILITKYILTRLPSKTNMADGFGFSRISKNNNNLFVARDLGKKIQRTTVFCNGMTIFDAIFFITVFQLHLSKLFWDHCTGIVMQLFFQALWFLSLIDYICNSRLYNDFKLYALV